MLKNVQIVQKKPGNGKHKNENQGGQAENSKMADLNPKISVVRLNVTYLNISIKRHILSDWILDEQMNK